MSVNIRSVSMTESLHFAGGRSPHMRFNMLYTVAVVLLVLWALGLVTSFTAGGLIHILLVVALVVLIVNVLQGRRVA